MKAYFYFLISITAMVMTTLASASTLVVESNRSDANSLLQFDLSKDGNLTPGAEIPTQGRGIIDPSLALGPFDSDQEILVSRERGLLFAVNTGSNSIAVFDMKSGRLVPVQGSPFYSHGVGPVSIGLVSNILTVVNKHNDPSQASDQSLPNYTTFKVQDDGALSWTGSTVQVANGSSPSQALATPLFDLIIGADFLGGILRSFQVSDSGQLHSRSVVGLPADQFANSGVPRLPLGLAAHPQKNIIYVGMPTANKIAVYEYGLFGYLAFKSSTVDSGNVVCWLLSNREGTRLYASNTADPSITVYDISGDPYTPKELQKLILPSKGGAYQIALTPDEKQFAVLTQRFQSSTPQGQGNEIHVLAVEPDGTLKLQQTPEVLNLPMDTRPQGIAIY